MLALYEEIYVLYASISIIADKFDQIKTSIKDYLRSNSNFTDYDFEGSNLSAIIDILAYNTYISSYNANMISNEVFIDSATLRENVVSLARNVGYVPRSRKSSSANISFFIDTSGYSFTPLTLTLKKGTVCTSAERFGEDSFSFTIPADITVPVTNGIAIFDNINVYEGTFLVKTFVVDANNPNQKFILDNSNIDTSSISVLVRNSQTSSITRKFTLADSLLDVTSDSRVFFIQEIEDQRYELIFGDGIFGAKLEDSNYIEVSYVTTEGESANGISNFSFSGRVVDNNDRVITGGISVLTTNTISRGGSEIESVESIKKYATRIYASQNRAVTASDYETIVPTIYPESESVSVFGGEELNPPQYGKVFISIKPINGAFVSSQIKENLKRSLRKYSVAGIVPEILDLKYLYVEYNITAYYNTNLAPSANYLQSIISNNLIRYSESSELNKYGARFKYSKFLNLIDNSNEAITSNITKINIRRNLTPRLNVFANYEICFGNSFHIKNTNGYNIKSSGFLIDGISDTLYISDIPNDDGVTGKIVYFKLASEANPQIVRDSVGTINYERGEINLYATNFISTLKTINGESIIEISAIPKSNDVIGLQDLYLQLDTSSSVLNMVADNISSGFDISGSSYTVTSSYSNGDYIRQ
jgi:hypothetical protein